MEIQPVVGIYDIGHNIAEWVDETPVQVSLETEMTGSNDGSGASSSTSTSRTMEQNIVTTEKGVATFSNLLIPL